MEYDIGDVSLSVQACQNVMLENLNEGLDALADEANKIDDVSLATSDSNNEQTADRIEAELMEASKANASTSGIADVRSQFVDSQRVVLESINRTYAFTEEK